MTEFNVYLVNGGWEDAEYLDGYLWSGGYYNTAYVIAETRGKARQAFIRSQNMIGYDYEWTDPIKMRKVASHFADRQSASKWIDALRNISTEHQIKADQYALTKVVGDTND